MVRNVRIIREAVEMELAKMTSKGQVTIPVQIRRKLNLKEGDKIIFMENENTVQIINSSIVALEKLQSAMDGEAKKAGFADEEDIMTYCAGIRKELYQKNYADND